jgi:putative transposase
MTEYRRPHTPGATWFFTVTLAQRKGNRLLVDRIEDLREAIRTVKRNRGFHIDAMVVLPEHLHAIWTMPPGEHDIGVCWGLIKANFSRTVPVGEFRRASRIARGERGVWQRRFWEQQIRDEADFTAHIDYIHYNPVKHGWVNKVADWPYSSFHRYVDKGWYGADWGSTPPALLVAGGE